MAMVIRLGTLIGVVGGLILGRLLMQNRAGLSEGGGILPLSGSDYMIAWIFIGLAVGILLVSSLTFLFSGFRKNRDRPLEGTSSST